MEKDIYGVTYKAVPFEGTIDPPEFMTVEEIDSCIHMFARQGWLKVDFDSPAYYPWVKFLETRGISSAQYLRTIVTAYATKYEFDYDGNNDTHG